jgi:molybdopterin converting factor small subunit
MAIKVIAEDLLPPGTAAELTLAANTVAEAAEGAGLTRRTGLVILVNGRLADWTMALADGDVVEFLPALGGG